MKKFAAFVCLAIIILSTAIIPGVAADGVDDERGINLVFIANADSIAGCADNTSLYDRLLNAAINEGQKIAIFFDVDVEYGADYASAVMKAYAADMSIGIFDGTHAGYNERAERALTYQKYVTKTVSRLILVNAGDASRYGEGFAVYGADIVLTNPSPLSPDRVARFDDIKLAVRIDEDITPAAVELISRLKDENMYIVTPTEAGGVRGDGGS